MRAYKFCDIPSKDVWSECHHDKISEKLTLKDILQNYWSEMEYVKVIRIRESMRNCSRLKDTKEIWQLNKQLDSELDPFAIKDIGTNVKIELRFKD